MRSLVPLVALPAWLAFAACGGGGVDITDPPPEGAEQESTGGEQPSDEEAQERARQSPIAHPEPRPDYPEKAPPARPGRGLPEKSPPPR